MVSPAQVEQCTAPRALGWELVLTRLALVSGGWQCALSPHWSLVWPGPATSNGSERSRDLKEEPFYKSQASNRPLGGVWSIVARLFQNVTRSKSPGAVLETCYRLQTIIGFAAPEAVPQPAALLIAARSLSPLLSWTGSIVQETSKSSKSAASLWNQVLHN